MPDAEARAPDAEARAPDAVAVGLDDIDIVMEAVWLPVELAPDEQAALVGSVTP